MCVGAVDGHFEEVEGQDQEEGGSDPVEAHHHEQPLLVVAESHRTLPDLSETVQLLLLIAVVLDQLLAQPLLHLEGIINFKLLGWATK